MQTAGVARAPRPVGVLADARGSSPLRDFCRAYASHRAALIGAGFLLLLLALAVLAPVIAPADPRAISRTALAPPSLAYPMGTDDLGRDVLSGVIYGSRVSLAVGLLAAATAGLIGIAVGMVSGYFGGPLDRLLMRLTELFQVLPQFFLALLIIALLGAGLEKIIFVVGILSWPGIARLTRVEFLALREREFVEAARALGCGSRR